MSRRLFKSTLIVSSMTMISRILGFVRDMLIAQCFGVNFATDAFFAVFKIPNFFRRLFAEGVFAQTVVPVLASYKDKSEHKALTGFIANCAGSFAVLMLLVSLFGIMAAPILVKLLAPGFVSETAQYQLAVQLLQIMLPYLLFITLVALAGSLLNVYGEFAVPALTPALLNICMIIATVWWAPLMQEPVTALAWGVFLAGVLQLLLQLPSLRRLGLLTAFRVDFNDAGVKRVLNQMVPAIFAVSVTQVNLLVDTLIASFLATGSVSWLYYSDRLVEFPLGLFGVAVATVLLPGLAQSHSSDNSHDFSQALDWALRVVILISVPATIGLILLAEPMLSTLFQYQEFDAAGVYQAGRSLRAYAVGLLGFILVRVLVPGFTARGDIKTPARYGFYAMLANLLLNLLLVWPLAHVGLALATSLGAFVNAVLLLWRLLKQKIYQPSPGWFVFGLRILLASAMLSALLYGFVEPKLWTTWAAAERVRHLLFWIMAGVFVYGATLLISGLKMRHLGVGFAAKTVRF